MILHTVLIIIFSTCCWCYTCPNNNETIAVNLTQFTGQWYMVAGVPITLKLGNCLHLQVNSSGRNFSMNFTTTSYRNNKRLLWKIVGEQFGNQLNATWQLSTSKRLIGPLRHQVLSLDYEHYCAIIICANDTTMIPRQIFAMILSRDRTLPNDTLSRLKDKISAYVDRSDILDADNTCGGISSDNPL